MMLIQKGSGRRAVQVSDALDVDGDIEFLVKKDYGDVAFYLNADQAKELISHFRKVFNLETGEIISTLQRSEPPDSFQGDQMKLTNKGITKEDLEWADTVIYEYEMEEEEKKQQRVLQN